MNQSWSPKHQKDYRLWYEWQKSGKDPQKLKPLLQNLDPLVKSRMNKFRHLETIPPSALEAEFKLKTLEALESYDPKKGVPLSIHVYNHLKGVNRFVYTYQNTARIPAGRVRNIGVFQAAYKELEQELGRPPTSHELADKLNWPVSEVTSMMTQLRKDLLPVEGSAAESAMANVSSPVKELMELMPYELDPFELLVYEHTTGYGGKPILGTVDIAKLLGTSPAKVSRTKAKIAKKMDAYLQQAEGSKFNI